MASTDKRTPILRENQFTAVMWSLCVVALLFLASRFAVRIMRQGKIMGNDYFLVAAAPVLLTGFAFLQSVLHRVYDVQNALSDVGGDSTSGQTTVLRRVAAAVEMVWIAIYLVKFCYFAQFKFYKAPYKFVDPHLTTYYWTAIGLCVAGFLFTIAQPVVLCPSPDECRYGYARDTGRWEAAVTAVDIVTDLLVVSIPAVLILNTKAIRSHTIANFVFKSLSILHTAVAATRLALQYDAEDGRVQYVSVTFLLVVEAAVALVTVSVSSYRGVFLDYLTAWQRKKRAQPTCLTVRHPTAAGGGGDQAGNAKATEQDGSMSDLPILSRISA